MSWVGLVKAQSNWEPVACFEVYTSGNPSNLKELKQFYPEELGKNPFDYICQAIYPKRLAAVIAATGP